MILWSDYSYNEKINVIDLDEAESHHISIYVRGCDKMIDSNSSMKDGGRKMLHDGSHGERYNFKEESEIMEWNIVS